jgi:hypothetical protein
MIELDNPAIHEVLDGITKCLASGVPVAEVQTIYLNRVKHAAGMMRLPRNDLARANLIEFVQEAVQQLAEQARPGPRLAITWERPPAA